MDRLLTSIFGEFWWFWEPSWEGKSRQERSKIDEQTHRKNDEKMRFGSPWVGEIAERATAGQRSWDPLIQQFSKKTTHHTPHTTRTFSHALRASAVADKKQKLDFAKK